MAFNLPDAQYLMRSNSTSNRGSFDNAFQTGLKNGGNLPITFSGTQVQNGGGNEGIYFGLDSQNSTSSKDASVNTKLLLSSFQFNAPNRIQVGTKAQRGVVARLTSGSGGGNYKEYIIGGSDTPLASAQDGPVTICIDLSSNSQDSIGGSYDNSNVTGWGFGTFKTNLVGGSSNLCFFQRVFLFDTGKGQPNLPTFTGNSNFDNAVESIQGSGYTTKIGNWCTKSGSAIFLPCPFSIGDGVNSVQFNDEGLSIISPSDNLNNQENFRLTNDAMRVYLDTIDGDSVILRGSYNWGTSANWDFDISNTSTCDLSGNFVGMGDFTLGSSVTASGNFNLASSSSVICNGANIDNINVTGDVKIQGSSVTDFSGLSINGVLDFDTAGTYNLSGCNISEVINTSGGNVIINATNTVITTNTGPNITINTSTAFALTGLQLNSEVRIYEAGTTTEITGVENSSSTFITTLSTSSVDISVLSLGFQNLRIKAIDTTIDVALPIQQVVDRQYQNN